MTVGRLDTTHAEVPVQTVFLQGITCGTQRHSVLYKTVGGVVGQEGSMETCSKRKSPQNAQVHPWVGHGVSLALSKCAATTSNMAISEWDCGTVQPCNGTLSDMEHWHIWHCKDNLCQPHWRCCHVRVHACVCVCVHACACLCVCVCAWVCDYIHCVLSMNHEHVHNVMYHPTTHSSSQAEVKSTLVHEVPHHWEATTSNWVVKACPTVLIHFKLPVSKEGQQVLNTLKGSTMGSKVKGSARTLCTWLVSWVERCVRLWVPLLSVTHFCFAKHISPIFQEHCHYMEVALPWSKHHWCCWLQERTIKWYSGTPPCRHS